MESGKSYVFSIFLPLSRSHRDETIKKKKKNVQRFASASSDGMRGSARGED